jgi:hypothetical protein
MAAGRKIEDEREARACLKAAKGENLGRWARGRAVTPASLIGHGTTLRRWSLSRAGPVTLVADDRDNESVIESVALSSCSASG